MGVSDHGPKIVQEHEIQAIAPLRIRKAKDGARERDGSNASRSRHSYHERSFFTAPTPSLPHRLSQPTPQELDARAHFAAMKQSRAGAEPITEELIPLPIIPRRDEALGSHRHPQAFKVVPQPTPQAPIATRSSDASLSSAESTGTVVRTKPRPSGGSYSAFPIYPRSGSSMSNSSLSASNKQASSKSDEDFSPGSPVSPISPVLSAFSSPHTRRAPSTSQTSHRHVSSQDGINIQYPALRSPFASKLWAESSPSEAIARPTRHPNRGSGRWNPHLSAVPSEDTEERNSGTTRRPDSSNPSDAHYASFPSNTRMLPPHPALLTVTRDVTDSTIRVVNEREDAGTALPPLPVPESRGSSYPGYTGRSLQDARRNTLQPRPSSRGSFRRDGIPAWARYASQFQRERHGSDDDQVLIRWQGCTTVVPAPAAALRRGRPPPPIACRGPALAPIASPYLKETLIPWRFRRPRPAGWSWRCVEDWSENRPRSGRHISGMIGDAWEGGGACSNRPAWKSTRWGPA
jgi:hypothetical protein